MTAQEDDGYILERTGAEYARLRLQALFWSTVTGRVLAAAGLAPGMRCVDVGCGPGVVMRQMADIAGASGHVTGIDIDAALGAHMLTELRKSGPEFDFVAADLMRGDPIPGAPFDFVFSRLLLLHMRDPVTAVRRLAALARPGGRLVLMDYDMSRLAARPENATLGRAFEIIAGSFEAAGLHADSGIRLGSYLAEAGLPLEGADAAGWYGAIRGFGPMVRAVIAGLATSATALGVATEAEIAEVLAGLQALEAENRNFGLGPVMVSVWTTVGPPS